MTTHSVNSKSTLTMVLMVARRTCAALAKDATDKAALAECPALAEALEAALERQLSGAAIRASNRDTGTKRANGRPPVGYYVDMEPGDAVVVWGSASAASKAGEVMRAYGSKRPTPATQSLHNQIATQGAWLINLEGDNGVVTLSVRRATKDEEATQRAREAAAVPEPTLLPTAEPGGAGRKKLAR